MFPSLAHYTVAHHILLGYIDYYYRFKLITKHARIRFERRDWHGIQADARSRITLYREDVGTTCAKVAELLQEIAVEVPGDSYGKDFWRDVRDAYAEEIAHFDSRNIAETFYNSVYRHYHGVGADPNLMFVVRTGTYREHLGLTEVAVNFDLGNTSYSQLVDRIIGLFPFGAPWEDLERDVSLVTHRLKAFVREKGYSTEDGQLEILRSLFFRNKIAYIVGRLVFGAEVYPVVIPLLHPEGRGIIVDALLLESDQVTSIFSYHRSYFLADVTLPSAMVDFLRSFMPTKRLSELYNAIGFEKHGKTVFFRELEDHLAEQPEEKFAAAPGIAGMVMYVFTTPTLNMVFKLIRDKFAPPKQVSEATVKEKYQLVKIHDRVGRMADSYVFEKLCLPRDRFTQDCIVELLLTAPSKITLTDEHLLISHVYIEKKMTPLNIFLENAEEEMARKALRDYGRAIKQLAAANIFPGDLLLKNFGVTRVNRVVFYDYDEIELVTDCNFRHIPEARTPEQEMAAQPWYYVGPKDIFPEEFPGFLMRAGPNLSYLRQRHPQIFDADFWNGVKERLLAGEIMDVFPYRSNWRFRQEYEKTEKESQIHK